MHAHTVIGKTRLDDIRVEHVKATMDAAAEQSAPEAGKRVRLRIEQVLNAAISNGQRVATLGNPAHVELIKAVRPTTRRGELPRRFTAGPGRTYRAARLRCQRRTTCSILVSMQRNLDTDPLNFRPSGS